MAEEVTFSACFTNDEVLTTKAGMSSQFLCCNSLGSSSSGWDPTALVLLLLLPPTPSKGLILEP